MAILLALCLTAFGRGLHRGPCRLDLNAVVDPGTPGYAANTSNNGYTYAVSSSDHNTAVTLDIYAVIEDASPSPTADGLTKVAGNFYLSDQPLIGAVGFNASARRSTRWPPILPARPACRNSNGRCRGADSR